ncbi:hypothetical protein LSTR_LSTR007147 [Laodelphax striatellus]|uniref:Methuselah N-terminal domain-containing protein n=1 Tax=Laodelphax striatellus TaxID=195883 RepID=A0A482WWB7_LAOST|nr:hypothetical protein LSTR_LSTR007147 [Laodelphax striatellus]
MAQLFCVPILVLFISASLAQDIIPDSDNPPPQQPEENQPDVDRPESRPVPSAPPKPTSPSKLPSELISEMLEGLLPADRKRNCKEWETIPLTMKDIEIPSNPMSIVKERAFTIKDGNLKGHKVQFDDIYDYNNKTYTAKVCACDIADAPCIPLCCKANQVASMKDGRLTCASTVKEDPVLLDDFAKHLVDKEKLLAHKFVIVHHNGLDSLRHCPNAAHTYLPGPSQRIEPRDGHLTLDQNEPSLEETDYCFLPEKKGQKYHFTPLYCQKAKSAGFHTSSLPLLTIASIAVLFLAVA